MREVSSLPLVRDWVRRLGGRAAGARDFAATDALAFGRFRFDGLDGEVEAPALPLVYASVTLAGPFHMEARLGGAPVRAHVQPGQSVLMAPGRSNVWRWDRPTEEALIFLAPEVLDTAAQELGDGRAELVDRVGFDDAPVRQTILAVADELGRAGGPAPLFLDLAAAALARQLLTRHCDRCTRPAAAGCLTARQLRRIVDLVEARLAEPIRLDDMAAAAGVSRFHFAHAFKGAVGEPPHRWLTNLRIDRAKDLLARTSLSVIEVAAAVGFESQSHFGHLFRARCGVTPREWRRRA